jgi:tRNA nucleotidyltransferase (CCA-adding enzyme)
METYIVGGWVRDRLLKTDRGTTAAGDRDWVLVGVDPLFLQAQGFTLVGRDFPVFLHPRTHEEFALARTERKTAPGYHGFEVHAAPDVTLRDDLRRRDLTINAMAIPASPDAPPVEVDPARVIDPYGGLHDLAARVLRHVGPAFIEDPVRILRLARFCARFPDFSVAPDTVELCRRMVASGETAALVPERVWQEWSRGLMESRPDRMIDFLQTVGVLGILVPGHAWASAGQQALQAAAQKGLDLPERFAVFAASSTLDDVWLAGWRGDTESVQLARLALILKDPIRHADSPAELLAVLDRADAWRRPGRVAQLLRALACVIPQLDLSRWHQAMTAARAVVAGEIARALIDRPSDIPGALALARRQAIARAL